MNAIRNVLHVIPPAGVWLEGYPNVRELETRARACATYPAAVSMAASTPTTGNAWPALCARGLVKSFGTKHAVAGVDLDVGRGSFFGIVGPNGAGKTTTLRMATGLLRPDTGRVWVDGVDVWAEPVAAKARIGVLPEELALFERLTGRELLTFHGLLREMDPDVVADRTGQLLDLLGLADAADVLVVDYSHGMRKKVALAAALIHAPRLLFLDEPFEAIDPVSARAIRNVLEEFTHGGSTIVFSSHVMELVERLCDHVAVMAGGRVVWAGALDDLRGTGTLEDAFVALVGGPAAREELPWLSSSHD
jgi:ABC-2 type transport system ATP-binding protein